MNTESKKYIIDHSTIMTAAEIAKELRVTRVTVYSWGVRQGLKFKRERRRRLRKKEKISLFFNEKAHSTWLI